MASPTAREPRLAVLGAASLSLDLDLAAATLLLPRRRYGDFEHAIAEARHGLVQPRCPPVEGSCGSSSIGSLAPVVTFPMLLLLPPPLISDRDHIVRDLHADIILVQAGEIGPDDELIAARKDLDLGYPGPRGEPEAAQHQAATKAEVVEEALHLAGELATNPKGSPPIQGASTAICRRAGIVRRPSGRSLARGSISPTAAPAPFFRSLSLFIARPPSSGFSDSRPAPR